MNTLYSCINASLNESHTDNLPRLMKELEKVLMEQESRQDLRNVLYAISDTLESAAKNKRKSTPEDEDVKNLLELMAERWYESSGKDWPAPPKGAYEN